MTHSHPKNQRGIALATALIFLVVITLLGLVAIRSSTTGLKLALNEQTQTKALVTAQSMVTTVVEKSTKLPNQSGESKVCYKFPVPWHGDTSPNEVDCPIPNNGQGSRAYVIIRRLSPKATPPPVKSLTSLARFGAGTFALRAIYDRSKQGLGAADIEQGVKRIVPQSRRTY